MGQGALAIETREGEASVQDLLSFLNDEATQLATTAERAFLQTVEGGCQVPVGVFAQLTGSEMMVTAIIASLDGKTLLREQRQGPKEEAYDLGCALAEHMLAIGGRQILAAIR